MFCPNAEYIKRLLLWVNLTPPTRITVDSSVTREEIQNMSERFAFECLAGLTKIMFECTQHEFQLKLYRFFAHMEKHVARFLSFLVEK